MIFYPMFYFDPTYVLILADVIVSMAASARLSSMYRRYSIIRNICGMTGTDTAKRLLANRGIYDVIVCRVPSNLTDHYDPRSKTVSLSDVAYDPTSIVTIEVVAHECGHAMQDANDYSPLRIRTVLVPMANLESQPC